MQFATGRKRYLGGPVVLALMLAAVVPARATAAPAGSAHTIRYHGVSLRVPAGWPVVDLDRHPATCARVDRHAIYLGTPDPAAACPSRVTGRTETVSLRPLTESVGPTTTVRATGLPRSAPRSTDHAASWALEAAGLLLSTTYGEHPEQVDAVLAGADLTSDARPATIRRAPTVTPEAATRVPGTYHGYGFDACQAPSSATMDGWLASSRFRSVGVYIGGGDLGCPDQPNLTAGWVSRQAGRGWHILPIYVGRQAPCSTTESFRISSPTAQGRSDADDAMAKARHYGMAAETVIISDMEFYPRGGSCSSSVLTYLSSWTRELNAHHYRSAVYSSRSAAIDDLIAARPSGRYRVPGTIDFAQWDGSPTVHDRSIPEKYWVSHHRIKQYDGAHNETHDGVTLNIDSNWVDTS